MDRSGHMIDPTVINTRKDQVCHSRESGNPEIPLPAGLDSGQARNDGC